MFITDTLSVTLKLILITYLCIKPPKITFLFLFYDIVKYFAFFLYKFFHIEIKSYDPYQSILEFK